MLKTGQAGKKLIFDKILVTHIELSSEKLFEKAIQRVWHDSSTELRRCLLNYLGNKKVIPPEKMTSLHFSFYRTVKVVEYFRQRIWRPDSLSSRIF